MSKFKILLAIALTGTLLYACRKEKGGTTSVSNDSFKTNMLVNYADTLIRPAYTDLQGKLNLLKQSADDFMASPSAGTQATLKAQFRSAYLSFQAVSALNFGPASALLLNNSFNTFPTATTKIEAGIQSGSYNLATIGTADSIQGFPALDYLFFSADALTKFTDAAAANRKQYAKDIIERMQSLLNNTISQWNGTYRETFTTSLQTNVGSSIGNLVNQFAYELDMLKGPRIGWPLGKQSNGIVFADKCEAYYSGITKELAIANLTSLKNYYTGGTGNGIDDYLVLLDKKQLNSDVLAQFETALTALQAIPDPMSAAFANSGSVVDAAYKEVQKLLTLLKTDVASATSVQIAYQDNDGD